MNSILTEIKICRLNFGISEPGKAIFRIRVYDIDSLTNTPSEDLCNQVIEVKNRSKNISINLEEYDIHILNKDFFVAIEWLMIPYNEDKKQVKLTDSSMVERTSYKPLIGWTDNTNSGTEAWQLDYRGNWTPLLKKGQKTSLLISATVKY